MRSYLSCCFADEGLLMSSAGTVADAERALERATDPPRLVVLDVRLPDGSGIDLCRAWRLRGIDVPILILTAQTDVASRVEGLEAGADDYLCKPFALAELRARVRSLLRRGGVAPEKEDRISFVDLDLDLRRRLAYHRGQELALTRREFDVLARLARGHGIVVAKDDILEEIWGEATPESAASLEVIIGRIRRKIDSPGGVSAIRTVRGIGYSFVRSQPEGEGSAR